MNKYINVFLGVSREDFQQLSLGLEHHYGIESQQFLMNIVIPLGESFMIEKLENHMANLSPPKKRKRNCASQKGPPTGAGAKGVLPLTMRPQCSRK